MTSEELAYSTLRLLRPLLIGLQATLESHEGRQRALTIPMRDALDLVKRLPDSLTAPHLASIMMQPRRSVQRVVDRLLREGLLAQLPNRTFARLPLLRLTALGAKKLDRVRVPELRTLKFIASGLPHRTWVETLRMDEHLLVEFEIRVQAQDDAGPPCRVETASPDEARARYCGGRPISPAQRSGGKAARSSRAATKDAAP